MKDFKETKKTSPTHSDPDVAMEYDHLFPKSSSYFKSNIQEDPIENLNKSTETVKPEIFKSKIKDNIPTDVTSSEMIPLTNPEKSIETPDQDKFDYHTYPPKPKWKIHKDRRKSKLHDPGDYPLARGFAEELDDMDWILSSSHLDAVNKKK